jgi:putative SOS response-associated peptidase YedK
MAKLKNATAEQRPARDRRHKTDVRGSFSARHCLVLADSFYEWQTLPNGKKQPYRIMLKSGEPFAMAGIYARSDDHQFGEAESAPVSFAILTTAANEIMQPIHERMPVILSSAARRTGYRPTPPACSSSRNSRPT